MKSPQMEKPNPSVSASASWRWRLRGVLTDSQLCCRVLVEPAELCAVDVVRCEDADELLQPFPA